MKFNSFDTQLGSTPFFIVYKEDRVTLKHYKPDIIKQKTPLLIVYALINRETILDIDPERSVIKNFLTQGFEIYLICWGSPSIRDKFLTIDDHIDYIDNMICFICKRHNILKLNLMGICMGGIFSIIYSALYPEKIKNLITTVTPTNFETKNGLLNLWMKNINLNDLIDSYGNMPGALLPLGFQLMNPAILTIDKYISLLKTSENQNSFNTFFHMEKWIYDSPDIPGETFRWFIKECYQQNLLIQNKMIINGQQISLKNIKMPLLNIYGEYDHLVPPESSKDFIKKTGSKDKENLCINAGHIGIYVSLKTQKKLVPYICQWIKKRDI